MIITITIIVIVVVIIIRNDTISYDNINCSNIIIIITY